MDEEMEVELPMFEAREVDLEYEFDAACFFDFTREESLAEALQAELWFQSAPNYPPSPFVAKLFLGENILRENVNTSPKTKVTASLENDPDYGMGTAASFPNVENKDSAGMTRGIVTNLETGNHQKVPNQPLNLTTGLTFYDHISHDKVKAGAKYPKKSHPRSSTLMKPTTSHLAKQNQPVQAGNFRFQMQPVQNGERSLLNSSVIESQAAKRQKLEGGHLRKVADMKPHTNLVHKAPKRDETTDKNSLHARLRLTIPREPDLETAHRAQRIRSKVIAEQENLTSVTRRFKARPLNRKILEAPTLPLPKKSVPRLPDFQEFRLKTSERAMQHTSTVSSSSHPCTAFDMGHNKAGGCSVLGNGNRELERPSGINNVKQDEFNATHTFKAHSLTKKIFSSKGEIGVFRNVKQETTVPLGFNLQTGKTLRPNPPVDLFSKLSLSTEQQSHYGSQLKLPQRTYIPIKGSKENRVNSFQEHEMTQLEKEKTSAFGGKQVLYGNERCINEADSHSSTRSLGIR